MHTRWVAVVLVVCVVALAGAAVGVFRRDLLWASVRAPAHATVQVNEASICLQGPGTNETGYRAFVVPIGAGCLSSSCTARYEERADVLLSPLTGSLHFNSRFVFADLTAVMMGCNADCGSGGTAEVDVPALADGTYGVWLGTTWLGAITVSEGGGWLQPSCLSSQTAGQPAPPTPRPIPASGTQAPYPAYPTVSPLPPAPGYPADPQAP